ncbi:hypothetical protein SeLEV6574_g00682 [Synchytrium endobioticum]|uniref:Uncharacterized protein n=1 Tax=Synchytrium endobioticum TaxID=286115 RepID=A0A507DH95_9FUNG|nr:hypothetical protein SeLEV6574_g00682 [Synchytrium endobioticum]
MIIDGKIGGAESENSPVIESKLYIDTTSKSPPTDLMAEDGTNLPNIFHNKFLRSTHERAWVIALDPGATCITGAVAFDLNDPNKRRNLAVTTKCLAESERRYREWLEADKPSPQLNGIVKEQRTRVSGGMLIKQNVAS